MTKLAEALPSTVPFVGPETLERQSGKPFLARIGANESGFGPSPTVIKAMQMAAAESWKYADPENHDLKMALAAHLSVGFANINVGPGVDTLLGHAVRLFAGPGDKVVTSFGAYPTFIYHVHGYGAELVTVPYRDDHEDLDGLLEAARRELPKVVYLANPDNPMGTWHSGDKIAAFAKALPEQTMLFLDEAYCETAPDGTVPTIDPNTPNVIRFRTFSKAYGMAGVRVGVVMGPEWAAKGFDKVRDHFGMNRMAQAGAIAALKDQDWLEKVIGEVAASRAAISTVAVTTGLKPIPSATNFVAIDCGRDAAYAKRILDGLISRQIFVRKPGTPVLDRCIRVSCGPEREMALFAEALPDAVREAE